MSPFLGTRGAGSNRAFGYAGAAAPAQVIGLTATDFGTSRAYNNGRIDLSWSTPANNGATITGYTIQRSTNGSSYSTLVANTGSTATTYSDTSLLSAQIYYYKISAINAAGTGLASTAANATATTVPQAPTIGTATASGLTASVTFTPGATGGATVTTYTATSSPGGLTGTSSSSPVSVSGLTGGTTYTFTVTATNANGTSAASAASNSVTPISYFAATTYGNQTEYPYGVATDSSNNIYYAGYWYSGSASYGYVAKHNSSGTLQWQKALQNNNTFFAVGVDSSANVYAVGADNKSYWTIAKYNTSGTLQWQRKLGNAPDNTYPAQAKGIAVDSSGNSYVVGYYDTSGASDLDGMLVKYDTNGTIQWQRRLYILYQNYANAVTVDSSGNIYVTGYAGFTGTGDDLVVYKYNSSGTIQWIKSLATSSVNVGDYGNGIVVDSSGNSYIAGTVNSGGSGNGKGKGFIAKYNTSGTLQWQRTLTNGTNIMDIYGIAIDSSANTYIAGGAAGTTNGLVIAKYNSSGTIQWQRLMTSSVAGNFSAKSIAIDSTGALVIAGYNNSSNQNLVFKLPSDGSKTGTFSLNGTTYTYSASSFTEAAGSLSETTPSYTDNAGGMSGATPTFTDFTPSLTAAVTTL